MSEHRHLLRVWLLFIICSALGILTVEAQAPPTIEASLEAYGVQFTKPELEAALKDKRPTVRGLAAGGLGEIGDSESVPLILAALNRETNAEARFNLAQSLLSLSPATGKQKLAEICTDKSVRLELRLAAINRLVEHDDTACVHALEDILQVSTDASIKESALLTLARVKNLPANLVPKTHEILVARLRDSNPAVRASAGECIAALGDRRVMADLKSALDTETDTVTKQHLEDALKVLEGKGDDETQ